ncbi:penicillin-binding protein 1C [Amphritea sp. HPY]|uniref:penicillin-binding protein 1C n=1 Tax=Amphritea sp. HPY TaxID=3421652 RepID=UPI003D7CFB24
MLSKHRIVACLSLIVATVAVVGLSLLWPLSAPLIGKPYSKLLLDRNGQLLSVKIAADEQWRFAPVSVLPDNYKTALIQFEDKRFLSHFGIDPLALARALYLNLSKRQVVSGGSTITMQLARMIYGNKPRSYGQKLLEFHLALRLEAQYSKQEILTLYAANAPMGGNTVGIEAAAWRYFGRRLSELTWAESALLAVLPNNPSAIHLTRGRGQLTAKRNQLLQKLQRKGYINVQDYQLSILEPVPGRPVEWPKRARHLLEELVKKHPQQAVFYSHIDSQLQQKIGFLLQQHSRRLAAIGVNNLALVVADNRTMRVTAYFGNVTPQAKTEYSPHVDIASKARSSGSTLKPFLYASMLDNGDIVPETLIPDVPTAYGSYQPTNYDKSYRGAVSAKDALVASLNIPAVRMLNEFSYQAFYGQLKQLGFSHLFRTADDYGLSLILGGAEVSLIDLTTAYANLSRQSQAAQQLHQQALVLSGDGQVHDPAAYPITPGAAWLTLDALSAVTRPGLHNMHEEFSGTKKIAWKTGTSYGLRDGWAIGTTKEITVGVWAGNANGEGRHLLTGTRAAAPVLFDTMNIIEDLNWLDKPVTALKTIEVCAENGYLPKYGCPRKQTSMPVSTQFEKISPHHYRVPIDSKTGLRSNGNCNKQGRLLSKTFFELPPSQAHFYRLRHASYTPIPAFGEDCEHNVSTILNAIEITYPRPGQLISLPRYLGGEQGEVILRANAKTPNAQLFWHLDQKYLGATRTFHELSVPVRPGRHLLRVIDEQGNIRQLRFTVVR